MAGGRTRGGESSVTLVARLLEEEVPGGEVEREKDGDDGSGILLFS